MYNKSYHNLGYLFFEIGEYDESLKFLNKAIEI
jgi:hypothetical protein